MPDPSRLSRRQLWYLVAVVAAVKLSYLGDYLTLLPFLEGPIFDSQIYLKQGLAVTRGRFADPALLAFGPLYGYYLGLLQAPEEPIIAMLGQFALGTLNLVLLFRLCRRLFDTPAALCAVALYLGYGTLLFYESKILSDTLLLSLCLWAQALFLSERFARGEPRAALLLGGVLGLAVLTRASALFCVPFFALLALLPFSAAQRGPLRARARRAALLCAGLGLVLLCNGLWNKRHSGHFVPVVFPAPLPAVAAGYDYSGRAEDLRYRADRGIWDSVWRAQARIQGRPVAAAPDVDLAALLKDVPAKLHGSLYDMEITGNLYSYYGERGELPVFWFLPFSFGVLMLLGVLGAGFLVRREGTLALLPYLPLWLGPLCLCLWHLPQSRYRLLMVLPALLLGAYGVVSLWRLPRRPRLQLGVPVALACALMIVRHERYRLPEPALWQALVARSAYIAEKDDMMHERIRRARALGPLSPALEEYLQGISVPTEHVIIRR